MPTEIVESKPEHGPSSACSHIEGAAKAVRDLDSLVQALLTSIPKLKPWQRQLRAELGEVDRLIEVLRLLIVMGRGESELANAAVELMAAMRAANAYAGVARTDAGTKSAILLGIALAQNVAKKLSQ